MLRKQQHSRVRRWYAVCCARRSTHFSLSSSITNFASLFEAVISLTLIAAAMNINGMLGKCIGTSIYYAAACTALVVKIK